MADMSLYDSERNLAHHPPRDETVVKEFQELRAQAMAFAKDIDISCPDGREKSLAFTKLEEALMWACAAIARSDYNRGV